MTDRLTYTPDLQPTFIESGDFRGKMGMRLKFPDGQEKDAVFLGNSTVPQSVEPTTYFLNTQIGAWKLNDDVEVQVAPALNVNRSSRSNGILFEEPDNKRYSVWAVQSEKTRDFIQSPQFARRVLSPKKNPAHQGVIRVARPSQI